MWSRRRDSNPHTTRYLLLRQARLPIPPLRERWSGRPDSNRRLLAPEASALAKLRHSPMKKWSERGDSNPHASRPRLLRPPRLPVPPRSDASRMVAKEGLEPPPPRGDLLLRQARLPVPPLRDVGALHGDRTHVTTLKGSRPDRLDERDEMVRPEGFEPSTLGLKVPCSTD